MNKNGFFVVVYEYVRRTIVTGSSTHEVATTATAAPRVNVVYNHHNGQSLPLMDGPNGSILSNGVFNVGNCPIMSYLYHGTV